MKFVGSIALILAMFGQPVQQTIPIRNPSFEDTPGQSRSPKGWMASTPSSTPDIMPGAWGVQFAPQDGQTCVGLVTREDGTCEDIGQGLAHPLQAGKCYTFSIYLAHAPKYVGYNHPVRLRVWGGQARGSKEMLLTSSPLVSHNDWKNYKFLFEPTKNVKYITLEAWYGAGTTFKYKGNILLDNCSPIDTCDRA